MIFIQILQKEQQILNFLEVLMKQYHYKVLQKKDKKLFYHYIFQLIQVN